LSGDGGDRYPSGVHCPRCGHENQPDARFCSSCGAPLPGDDATTTLALTAVEAAEDADDLAQFLVGLPEGVGLLVVRHGPNVGSTYRLDTDRTTIGRHPDSDIFLDDITVSRRHVAIERNPDGAFVLRDVGSLNGTYVNHERVDESPLHHGDEVQIGKYRLSFVQAA
jgi:pSer/pThr/pTyr-binding forkhead associated (FHA) protein